MNAKRRIEAPASPEILNFPEKPTLKDLLLSNPETITRSNRRKEEKPETVSPLFCPMQPSDGPVPRATQPCVADRESAPQEVVLQNLQNEPIGVGEAELEKLKQNRIMKIREAFGDAAPTPSMMLAPTYEHFRHLENIPPVPKPFMRHNALTTCMIAIMSCAFAGMICSIVVITLLLI